MSELSTFITEHPYVTLGVFMLVGDLIHSIGKIARGRCCCGKRGGHG